MSENSHLVIPEALKCVEKIGIDKTLEGLKKLQFEEINYMDKRVEFVVTQVAEKTGVPAYEIMFGTGRKNERKYAIGFCAYYLHSSEFYNIEMDKVLMFLNKNVTVCYMYSKLIARINPTHKSDKKFSDIKIELDSLFRKSNKK